jgi:trigger factor
MPETAPSALKINTRPAAKSTVVLEVEVPATRVQRSIDESVRHLGRRTRVPGFRPGKVPRPMLERALGVRRDDPTAPDPVYDDAKEHLFEASVVEALRETDLDVLSIPAPEWTRFDEGAGAAYRITVPVRPEVKLGAYTGYPFSIELDTIDDAKVDAVLEQLRDQQASLVPVEDRPAEDGDYAVVRFEGRRDGEPIEGASSDRFPLVLGAERMIPGFEAQIVGMRDGEEKTFPIRFPEDYKEASLAGVEAEFTVELRELRQKSLPPLDDDLARSLGDYADLAALREEVARRLERNARDRARHAFADRIIEFATANATVEVPDLLVDREVDVMLDELRVRLGEQGIGFDDYLRATEREEASLRDEYRDQAEHRVKVLLVLGAIAAAEGIEVDDAAVEAELERGRAANQDSPKLIAYLESPRGRDYIRSQLRRTLTVETLIDRWIAEHPEFSDVRHIEDEGGHGATPAPAVAQSASPEGNAS